MAQEYFLYTTEFNNTLVDRSNSSFAPLPPNTGEIFIDFFIPTNQPLYYYRESGGTIVLNDEDTIAAYLDATIPPTEEEEALQNIITGITAGTVVAVEDRVRWLNVYTGGTYQKNDMVRDGDFTMIANKETDDIPSPQAVGEVESAFDNNPDAPFTIQSEASVQQVVIGQRYQSGINSTGWIKEVRFFNPVVNNDVFLDAFLIINPTGSTPTSVSLGSFNFIREGWFTIAAGQTIIPPQTTFDVVGILRNRGGGSTSFNSTWSYKRTNSSPSDGEIAHTNNSRTLKISFLDKDDIDFSTQLLSLNAGDEIQAGNITWTITEIVNVTGNRIEVDITPRTRIEENDYTFTFTQFAPATVPYPEIIDFYTGTTQVRGFQGVDSEYSGGTIPLNDDAYGFDVSFQPAEFSDDWDFVATFSDVAGNGGGATTVYWGDVVGDIQNQTDLQAQFSDVDADIAVVSAATLNKIDKVLGATGNVGTFLANGNLEDSGFSIADLTGGTGGGADGVVSGATLNGSTLELSRTEGLSDVTVDLAPLTGDTVSQGEFNTYTGDTAVALDNKVDVSGDTITGDLKVEGSVFITGTSATTQQLESAVLLGGLTTDGRIVATNTPALTVSSEVTDISGNTTITELSGIYYVDTSAGDVTVQIPDAVPSNDVATVTILKKSMDSNNVIITTTGGTQQIGRQTTQTISQDDKGLTIVSDADNNKWLVTVDSRFPDGEDEGTLLSWDNTNKVWKSTTNDVTWNSDDLIFTVGGNSSPETFQVDAGDDIVYINTSGLTGLTAADDLGFYAGGRGAFGNAVTLERLRGNTPSNQPRSLSLIDTNSTFRIWRFVDDGNDPAIEFVWGTGNTPTTGNNKWWDVFMDGLTDSLNFRRRTATGGTNGVIFSCFDDRIELNVDVEFAQKQNLAIYSNPAINEGDLWYASENELFFRTSANTFNLLDVPTALTAVQIRRTTTAAVPATWGDITFDTTDVENNPAIISADTTNTDNIVIGDSGLFEITYDGVVNAGSQFRLRINDTTVIGGSEKDVFATVGGLATINPNLDISTTTLVELNGGDFITLQAQQGTAGAATILEQLTLKITKLDAGRGSTGPAGEKGEPGNGVAIIVNDDGVNPSPTGGSYTTLNFSSGIAAVDSGTAGVVNISAVTSSNPTANTIQLIDSTGGQATNNVTPATITWDSQPILDSSVFSYSAGVITVLQAGFYKLAYNLRTTSPNNTRGNQGVSFNLNGSGFVLPTTTASYKRNASNNDTSNTLSSYIIELSVNDTLELQAYRLGDTADLSTVAGESFLNIEFIG